VQRELERRAAKALERATRALEPNVESVTRVGTAGAEILHVLEHDPTIDLVVTGSHSRTGIKRILLGSVAEKIVRHARCPVLVARVHA
jgi:nucleotide-binding universal stress UspA family protein